MIRAEWERRRGVPPSPGLDRAHALLPLGSLTAALERLEKGNLVGRPK